MKFRCPCGEAVYDQTDFLPYKAELLADQDWEIRNGIIEADSHSFLSAVRDGRRTEWIQAFYRCDESQAAQREDRDVIWEIIDRADFPLKREIYQCEACGRLFFQHPRDPKNPKFIVFAPEGDDWKEVLAGKQEGPAEFLPSPYERRED